MYGFIEKLRKNTFREIVLNCIVLYGSVVYRC